MLTAWAPYAASGFAVGLLVGMTGVGGGSLMTPLLILLFGLHPSTAVGTDLLYAAASKTAGTAFHNWRGSVDWRIVARLVAGSLPATALTILLLHRASAHGAGVNQILAPVLAATLVLAALLLLSRERLLAVAARHAPPPPRRVAALTVGSGVVLGVLVSLTSVGAGALGMAALVLLYPRHPTVRLVGSDIAHAVPLTLAAGIGHWYLGSVDGRLLLLLLSGALPGIVLGSYLANRVPGQVLRCLLAATLLLAAWRLVA